MAETPRTFSESWYRVANQKICLRPVVKTRRQNFRGERWIILENPFSNQYYRLRPAAYEFVARLRPDRTVEEVWQECLGRFPDAAPSQEAVIQLLAQLYSANLLQYDLAADSAQLFERYKKRKQREFGIRLLNIPFMQFPLLDPDRFLVRTLPFIGKLISPFGVVLWLLIVGFGLKMAFENFDELGKPWEGILVGNGLLLICAGWIVKTLHELGHAWFCRRFGGEVHVLGIMLMVFVPMPYMDATSSWSFRERWKRVLVAAAGMITELFFAAIAMFVWVGTGPGLLHNLAYRIMFIASVSTVVFNINPLLRFDGYYILSDLLEIPNLNQRAMMQLQYWAERWLFGVKNAVSPAGNRREAGWLGAYGIASGIYRVILFSIIVLTVSDRFPDWFLIIGFIIIAAYIVVPYFVLPVVHYIKYLSSSPRLDRVRRRAIGVTVGIAALLVLLLAVIPFPYSFRAPGVVVALQRTTVINEISGQMVTVMAAPGSHVRQGDPLLKLENPELQLQIASTRAHLDEINARLLQAMDKDSANIEPLTHLRASVNAELDKLSEDASHLIVRARHDGVWVAPGINEFTGRWLERGSDLGLLANPAAFEFEATVTENDARSLFGKNIHAASVRLAGEAATKLPVTEWRVIPGGQSVLPSPALGWAGGGEIPIAMDDNGRGSKSAEPFFEVIGKLDPDRNVALLDGRSGKINFKLPAEPLLQRWMRSFWQLFQRRYQI